MVSIYGRGLGRTRVPSAMILFHMVTDIGKHHCFSTPPGCRLPTVRILPLITAMYCGRLHRFVIFVRGFNVREKRRIPGRQNRDRRLGRADGHPRSLTLRSHSFAWMVNVTACGTVCQQNSKSRCYPVDPIVHKACKNLRQKVVKMPRRRPACCDCLNIRARMHTLPAIEVEIKCRRSVVRFFTAPCRPAALRG